MEAGSASTPRSHQWLGVCVVIVVGVAMAMVGRLEHSKKVSVALALAGAVGVGAAIYLCCRNDSEKKKGRRPATKSEALPQSTSPGVEEVEKVTATVTSQVNAAPKREEPTEQVAQDLIQKTEEPTIQAAPDAQELIHDQDHFATSSDNGSNGLETKDENGIVVVERKDRPAPGACDTPPSLSDSPFHDWKPDPVVLPEQTDESISFDGSIITQEKLDVLESQPAAKKESDCSFDGSIITKEEIEDCRAAQELYGDHTNSQPTADSAEKPQESCGDDGCGEQLQKESISNLESLIIPSDKPEPAKPQEEESKVESTTKDLIPEQVVETLASKPEHVETDETPDEVATEEKPLDDGNVAPASPDDDSGFLGSPTSPEGVGMATPDRSADSPPASDGQAPVDITQDQVKDIPKDSSSESEAEDEDSEKEHCSDVWVPLPYVEDEDIEFGIKIKTTPTKGQQQHDVVDVHDESLAARVGLKTGDSLVRLNGMGISQWSHDILMEQFRLVPMEDIDFTVQRHDGDKTYFKDLKAKLSQTEQQESHSEEEVEGVDTRTLLRSRSPGLAVSSEEFDVSEDSLSGDRDMIIANYAGTDRKRKCQVLAIGADLFYVQARGHQLKAGRLEDGEGEQFTFRREMFNCIDKCPESPYFQQPIYVFVFRAGSKGQQQGYITALSRTRVGLQRKERLRTRIHALSRADPRFFIHHFSASGFDCFESTQLPGHYLARDGDRMYLQWVGSDKERDHCSHAHFRINYL